MADRGTTRVLTDAQWKRLSPLIEAVRPRGKTGHHDLRRTIEAIIWRHRNGATWRSIPAELGPWWMAAQTFNRWSHLGVWERLLDLAQERRSEEHTSELQSRQYLVCRLLLEKKPRRVRERAAGMML